MRKALPRHDVIIVIFYILYIFIASVSPCEFARIDAGIGLTLPLSIQPQSKFWPLLLEYVHKLYAGLAVFCLLLLYQSSQLIWFICHILQGYSTGQWSNLEEYEQTDQ